MSSSLFPVGHLHSWVPFFVRYESFKLISRAADVEKVLFSSRIIGGGGGREKRERIQSGKSCATGRAQPGGGGVSGISGDVSNLSFVPTLSHPKKKQYQRDTFFKDRVDRSIISTSSD